MDTARSPATGPRRYSRHELVTARQPSGTPKGDNCLQGGHAYRIPPGITRADLPDHRSDATNHLKIGARSFDAIDMALLRTSVISTSGLDDTDLVAGPVARRSVGRLQRQLDVLEIERDCLRKALIDAGYSLKVEPIAKYAAEVSRRGPARVPRTPASGTCLRLLLRRSRSAQRPFPE